MEDQNSFIGTLFEKTEDYARTTLELQKLKLIDKSANVVSTLVIYMIVFFFVGICFLILSIGIAIWLNEIVDSTYQGYLIVAGSLAILGLVAFICRNKWIKTPIRNMIITEAMK